MKCQQILNNKQCGANAMKNSDYCYYHNPNISKEEKLKSQRCGGQNRGPKINKPLPFIKIKNTKDIKQLLTETINQVRTGELDCRIANTIGYLAGITIKSLEVSTLEKKGEKINIFVTKYV